MNQFIAIDGVDGAGKTSLALKLAETLGMKYYKTPSGAYAKYRSEVDKDAKPFQRYSYYRLAIQHDSEQIAKILSETSVVVDRYVASTIAYHVAMDPRIMEIHSSSGLISPNLTILLTANRGVRTERIFKRRLEEGKPTDIMLEDNQDFLDKVVVEFRKLPKLDEIDTSYLSKEQVLAKAIHMVQTVE